MKNDAPEARDRPFTLPQAVLDALRCPVTRQPLRIEQRADGADLVTPDGAARYPVVGGIPVLIPAPPADRGQ